MFSKQFKLTLASIFGFVVVVGLLAQISILTFRVASLEKSANTTKITSIQPTVAPSTVISLTATPSAGLKVVTPKKVVASPTKYIVAPTKVIVPISASPTQ